ncbi:MAG: hypothetical protein AAGL68_05545 [Pseudomonadota bacterium]
MEVDREPSRSVSTPTSEESRTRIMDEIERQVQLPPDADEFQQYAQYYAYDGDRVIATYITSGGNDPLKGKRLWLADRRDLPVLMDGGCAVVNVIYDPLAQRVEHIFCNGLA